MSDSDLQYHSNTDENANENALEQHKEVAYLNFVNNNSDENKPALWASDSRAHVTNTKGPKSLKTLTCDDIKHNTDLYNPDKLNKGQYLEVKFKNDLIFDLDMWASQFILVACKILHWLFDRIFLLFWLCTSYSVSQCCIVLAWVVDLDLSFLLKFPTWIMFLPSLYLDI